MFEIILLINFFTTSILWRYVFDSEKESAFSPFFWYLCFHSIVFVVRPLYGFFVDLPTAFDYMQLNVSDVLLAKTQLVTLVGLLCFFAGHMYSTQHSKKISVVEVFHLDWRAIFLTWLTLGSVAIYSAIFTGSRTISGVGIEMDRVDGVAINVDQSGYLLDAQFMLVGLIIMTAYKARFRLWSLMPVVIFFAYRSIMGWGRWTIVLTCIGLGLLWVYQNKLRFPPKKMILLALPLLILFSILGENRSALRDLFFEGAEISVKESDSRGFITKSFDSLDFANNDYLAYVVKNVPDKSGTFTYATQHLQIFTEPIPRALWSGKPAGAPIKFFSLNEFGNFEGLTVSVLGDGWLSLGWLGVILTLFLYGAGCGYLYSRFLATSDSVYCVVYISIAALFIQIFRDGSLVTIIKFSAFSIIPIYTAKLIHKCLR